ncbi:MAG: SpoIIE family protein phosphatase [Spirochaetales bacterium]
MRAATPLMPEVSVALVLIVDDDPLSSALLREWLTRGGFSTHLAPSLAEARSVLATHPVNLILLDRYLPDGDGLDLCAELNQANEELSIPVLLLSGDGSVETKVKAFDNGASDFLTKPVAGPEVLARVRTHLRLREASTRLTSLVEERLGRLTAAQQSLMPSPLERADAGFAVCFRPVLAAGGDFYDVIPSGHETTDYVVADASGHDLGTALWTASFKALLSEYASVLHQPAEIFSRLNSSLRKFLPETLYFTSVLVRLNRPAGRLLVANAGHPAVAVVRGDERPWYLEQAGDIIGGFADPVYPVTEFTVSPRDRVFLYTDGLIEGPSGRDEGRAALLRLLEQHRYLPLGEAVKAVVDALSSRRARHDDVVLLGIQV